VTFLGFSTSAHGKNCTSSPQADLIFKSRDVAEEETLKRKFCLFPGWSTMEISPRAKLEEEKRLLHATIASFKVARFCLLAHTHEEAVLEDEEAKHIERMMMRCVTRFTNGEKVVIFRKKRNE
jgi:hypothetical protein